MSPTPSPVVESGREQALHAAEACTQLLLGRFGVRRVILFGSLAHKAHWHKRSDIDLAAEGLAPEEFFAAYSACRDLLPPGLHLDLVSLESVSPEMRMRVLGEVTMSSDADTRRALEALVDDELKALQRLSAEMTQLLAQIEEAPTRIQIRAAAGMLHEFYTGVERILERVAMGFGEGIPEGSGWHVDLLSRMAHEKEGIRGAVIEEGLRARLKDYLDFRHFFRHAYGYTLEWSQLRWKAERLSETLDLLRDQLHSFFVRDN
jgi:predicted nucleotidyltransferase